MKHDETKLPVWAQDRLEMLREDLENLREVHTILQTREWLVIDPPLKSEKWPEDVISLFTLSRDGSRCFCSLARGDALLIGRAREQ